MLSDESIESFWKAWGDIRAALEIDIAAGEYGDGTEGLTDAVETIHDDLEWEIRDGKSARHALCLSSGDPGLRHLAQRWVDAAPPADTVWEFHPARTPIEPEMFEIDGLDIDPALATCFAEVDPDAEHLSITVSHPEFRGLDEANRFQATFRMIDDLLGEDGTEKWIGSVDATPIVPHGAAPLTDLPRMVDELAATATGERWVVFEDEDPSDPSSLDINLAVKRLDHVYATDYVSANLHFEDPEGQAVPTEEQAAQLNALEDELLAAIGHRGIAFARGLFPGILVLHFYMEPEATPIAEDWAMRHRTTVYHLDVESDPGWDRMHELY
jgi:hypothetical protein